MTFNKPVGEWIGTLTEIAKILRNIDAPKPLVVLEYDYSDDDLDKMTDVSKLLIEFTVKLRNMKWIFHKTDADSWPSPFHGHDYERNLKIDAITGKLYDVSTRKIIGKLKKNKLADLQSKLKKSPDLEHLCPLIKP